MKPYPALAAVLATAIACALYLFFRVPPPTTGHTRADVPQTEALASATPLRPAVTAIATTNPPSSPAPLPTSSLRRVEPASPDPVREPAFAAFNDWLRRYQNAPETQRAALAAEGEALARERRAAMFSLIQTDPDRAIELALSRAARRGLPANIGGLAEERVNARGDYEVLAAVPLPGAAREVPPIQRHVTLEDGRRFRAFPASFRRDYPTKFNVPLGGVAQDEVMAVGNPVEVLSSEEASQLAAAQTIDPVCSVSGEIAATGPEATAVQVGGDLHWMCQYGHAEWMNGKLLAAAGQPGGSSLEGGLAESNYTEGRKRIILFRVAFPNVTTPSLTVLAGRQMLTNMHNYWRIISYGRTTVAMPGEGSDVVLVTLTQPTANYDDDAGKLRADVRAAATASGVDLSKYDFDITCVGGSPSFSFAGLAYVGAPGAWLANGYFGTATAGHELGHNLGNPHANYWDTGGASAIGPGGNEEYGDPYDIMGGGGTPQGHYVAKFKWRIGWLADTDFPRITTSGRHRIYAQDNPDATGVRGLRFARNGSMDYYVEFRQLYTGNNWLMNGLRLCWGNSGSSWGSQFIDTTPGSANGKNDSPILIGQTFTDPAANVHITPIGKGNTYPESLDVIVNFGTASSNLPPIVTLGASATAVSPGTVVNFSAAATDPNGDVLAYYWEFDDGGYSVNNSPVQSHSFSSAGDYSVRCVVSDTKGGKTTASMLIRVGNPTTFTIAGRVLDNNHPVEGVLVRAGSRLTYTASDGTYTLTRLGAGSHTVTAGLYPYTLIRPWSPASITVGPSASNVDFINLPGGIPQVTLVSNGSTWKYLDNGSDPGTAWRQPSFNDASWVSGPAELGYGDDDEARVVSYGSDPDNKHVTTYFRHAFNVTNLAAVTNLILRLHRDDGGIVYLNGVEVFRDNMPAGTVNYRTLAVSGVEGETVQTNLPYSLLLTGTNVLAVEIHQVQVDSSDLSFDLSLSGDSTATGQSYSALYVASPAQGARLTAPTNVTVTANAFNTGGSFTLLEFYADGVKFGEDATPPYTAAWINPALGAHTLAVRATIAAGGFATSAPVNVTVGEAVPPVTSITLIPAGASWKYRDNGLNFGTAWRARVFNDAAWASGAAELGYGDGDEATTVSYGSSSSAKHITTYFRRAFVVDDPTTITNLAVSVLRDDGAAVYLNGVEIFRDNLPEGTLTYTTLALDAIEDDNTFVSAAVNPSLLLPGTNVVAVEIHQESGGSSDISFNLIMSGQASGPRPRGVYLAGPSDGQQFAAPANVPLDAVAVPAAGQSIARVEFYSGNTLLAEDTAAPFSAIWSNAAVGLWTITARAYENGGTILTSAPVSVTVNAPAAGTELVSSRALWRYLDDGSEQSPAQWTQRTFDDSEWSEGYARFGYGGDGEYTTVSYGPDSNKRFITTYFRRKFVLNSTAGISNLKLLLSSDDAPVVYLNGFEVHRSNLLSGPVSFNSLALTTVEAPDETSFTAVNISPSRLVPGTNVLAVEVHQASLGSSDLGFDLQLIAERTTNSSNGIYLTSPANGAHITLPAAINLNAFATAASGDSVTAVEFYVDGVLIGSDANAPHGVVWNNAAIGQHAVTARALFANAPAADAPAIAIVVDGPPAQIAPVFETYIATGSSWRFWSNGVQPAANWTALTYDDSAWFVRNAKFGWGLDGETTLLPSGRTHYFRRAFNVANPALLDSLIVQLQRDDGAVVYLNGVELFRSNMPGGAVHSGTLASSTVDGLNEQTHFLAQFPATGVRAGSNVMAVEIHQASVNSSDMGFDLQLNAAGTTAPRVVIGTPAPQQLFVAPADVPIEAYASAGSGRTITSMEFFVDGASIGETPAAPFQFTWTNAPLGTYTIVARALDNFGAGITSAPVRIVVGYPPVSLEFIPANSIWKYLDNGSNQGTNWSQRTFNDAAWASGAAELGYGDSSDGFPENTVVSYGPSSSSKFVTTYFRRAFVAPADAIITNLTFRLLRDDGAVVWLNGRELYRSNMPGGVITSSTLASGAVSDEDEQTFFETKIATTNVLAGTNIVAVEIHQNARNSSDLGFDLQLQGDGYIPAVSVPALTATTGEGQIQLAWPVNAAGYELRSTLELGAGASWQLVPTAPAVSNGFNVLSIPATNPAAFYRLQKP
jgi:hypothetical protein